MASAYPLTAFGPQRENQDTMKKIDAETLKLAALAFELAFALNAREDLAGDACRAAFDAGRAILVSVDLEIGREVAERILDTSEFSAEDIAAHWAAATEEPNPGRHMTPTTAQIEALSTEAASAGERALAGDADAVAECARVIANAAAQERCLAVSVYWDDLDPTNAGWAWRCEHPSDSGALYEVTRRDISTEDAKSLAREALGSMFSGCAELVHTVRVHWNGESDPLVLDASEVAS